MPWGARTPQLPGGGKEGGSGGYGGHPWGKGGIGAVVGEDNGGGSRVIRGRGAAGDNGGEYVTKGGNRGQCGGAMGGNGGAPMG